MLTRLRSLAGALFWRGRFEKSMTDEMRFHIDAYAADLMRSGVPAAEARHRARAEFGGVEAIQDECRQARGLRLMDELRQDLRYALRQLARSPVLASAAIVSLALGIGANTAIFSVMDAALFRLLPVRDPHELYYLGHTAGSEVSTSANYPLLERYREAGVFDGVTAYSHESFLATTPAGVERVNGQYVSGNYHAVVGVPMILGRGFTAESDRDVGGSAIAVISEGYWNREFGRARDVIGRRLTVGRRVMTIVGVTAAGFHGLVPGAHIDLTLPMSMKVLDEPGYLDARDGWISLALVARLKPGTDAAQATAAVGPLFDRYWTEPENEWARRDGNPRYGALVPADRGSGDLRGRYGKALWVLMGMVAIVLLIACVNVANLLHARAITREREVTVRLSIGAGRFRLIRQFLTESLLLAAAGGLLGLLIARWSAHALVSVLQTGPYPTLLELSLDGRVLTFTAALSVLTGVAFGLLPALRTTRVDLAPALRQGGAVTTRRGERAVGHVLVAGQIALCVLLMAASGLLVRSLRNLNTIEAGFARENVLLIDVETLRSVGRRLPYFMELLDQLHALRGVESVALAWRSPVDGSAQERAIEVPGVQPRPELEFRGVSSNMITPEYFRALDIGLVRGRVFTEQDQEDSPGVAVVSESMARTWFGSTDVLGHIIVLGGNRDTLTIVGMVRDALHEGVRETAPPSVYTPLAQFDLSEGVTADLTVIARTHGDPRLLATSVAEHIRASSADAAVTWVRTIRQQVDVSLLRERLLARLSSAFAFLALLLAITGLYGVVSYNVARRAREIGIRVALGATRMTMIRHILREVSVLALAGIVIGIGLTLVSTRTVAAFLFGLTPHDPLTLAAVGAGLFATTLLAGYLPARHAAALDPVQTLRAE